MPHAAQAQLDEREVVALGEETDPVAAARAAPQTVQSAPVEVRAEAVAAVHRASSLPGVPDRAQHGRRGMTPILPWGIMSRMSSTSSDRPAGRVDRRPAAAADRTTAAGHQDDTFRHSYSKDRAQLLRRLSRIEGQVRGIARMIEREEYCIDILQQTAALRAAVDAVSLLVLEDHVQGCVRTAAERGEADEYVDEVMDVVRRTLGRPVADRGAAAPSVARLGGPQTGETAGRAAAGIIHIEASRNAQTGQSYPQLPRRPSSIRG